MENAGTVKVTIANTLGIPISSAALPLNIPMERLIKALVRKLHHPLVTNEGQDIIYRLIHQGHEIPQNETLEQAHVGDGATLILSQEGEAGLNLSIARSTGEHRDELSNSEA